jgi:hypothetical protein
MPIQPNERISRIAICTITRSSRAGRRRQYGGRQLYFLEEPILSSGSRLDDTEEDAFGKETRQAGGDDHVACLDLLNPGDVFQVASRRSCALKDSLGAAPLDHGIDVAVLIDEQQDPGGVPGGFDDPSHRSQV